MTGRERVLVLLEKAQTEGTYSNLALDAELEKNSSERAFIPALFYGVTERRMTLDHIIRTYSKTEFDKIENKTLQLLRMGLYQLLYMEIPDSAAVNETVKLSPERSKGFINAILRSFLRDNKIIRLDGLDELSSLSVRYSCARWIVKMWVNDYGIQQAEKLLSASFDRPPVYARVNTLLCDADELIYELAEDGVRAERYNDSENCVVIENPGSINRLRAYRNGLFHIQDISSQNCCEFLDPKPGQTIIDMCAAPGGKSFTVAEMMKNKGAVYSTDLYESRTELIKSGAQRLGLSIIITRTGDSSVFDESMPIADRVLCDVPCSGFGVIRRKPEIKYKSKSEADDITDVQKKIVINAVKYLKPGGMMVYSTCTLRRAENEDMTEWIKEETNGLDLIGMNTYFPDEKGGDGFFMALFRKQV